MKKIIVALLLSLIHLSALAESALIEQPPIEFSPMPVDTVAKLIPMAIAGRGWVTRTTGPGHYEAKIDRQKFWVAVDIAYTDRQVVITYLDSKNFGYRNGGGGMPTTIHGKYSSWTHKMASDIRKAILTYQVNSSAGFKASQNNSADDADE
ncbi:hypothetical protein [Chitinolyticbacter albus]|uniref:hypothetical protein n=1 Tax=Chitinolyticbacter albus TaxID=2961951 RepID=UPI00210B1635|nr:hypothetical protein [Chitinolyticbacter albus]